jgi:caffeoyl-CoA O-methyltransferase
MKGTPLTEESFNYIVDLFAKEEVALLHRMSKRAHEAGVPMIMISEEQAKFIGFFLKAIKAKRVLDVGTLFGYSAAVMSCAMGPDASVVSLEFSPMHADVAEANLDTEGIRNVEIIVGPAAESLKTLTPASFDFILIDADKENYSIYLDFALTLIKPGGVIAGDNALAWGKITNFNISKEDPDHLSVTSMQSFNLSFANEESLFSIVVPVGDGMAMGVMKGE